MIQYFNQDLIYFNQTESKILNEYSIQLINIIWIN